MTSQRTSGLPPVAAEGAIAVFGAAGAVGHHAVEQLLDAGQEVIAVVRDPSKVFAPELFTGPRGLASP